MSDVQVDPSELARAERSVGFWDRLPFSFGEQPRSHVVIRTARQAGFRTGEAKIAVHNGRITRAPGVEVPDAVLTALSPNYRSADDPLTAIETAHGPFAGHTVAVTRAHRGTADFPTDRGPRTFPAYVLELEDTLGPAVVLDPGLARHSVAGVDGVFVVRVRDVSGVSDGEARPGLGGTPGGREAGGPAGRRWSDIDGRVHGQPGDLHRLSFRPRRGGQERRRRHPDRRRPPLA